MKEGTRPFVLVVIDGWGSNPDTFGNAIAAARTPHMDRLGETQPHCVVAASGEAVGLPEGQQGNSEVGHLTIGAGRVIYQPLTRLNRDLKDGSFHTNSTLVAAVDSALERGRALHLLGLISPGGVHSHQGHAVAVCEIAAKRGLDRVFVHVFTDGRDEPPTSAAEFVQEFAGSLDALGVGRIASVSGRYYAMDRDGRWERIARAYEVIAGNGDTCADDAVAYIRAQYAAGSTDEFMPPVSICADGEAPARIADGDSVVFFNFRPDRGRQLSHALVDPAFDHFSRSRVPRDLFYVTMTEYERNLPVHVAYPREDVNHSLAEIVSDTGASQFHVAETEKYAHVTYFINGGREAPFPGEDRLLVPSPKVATYDTMPQMSAEPVTDAVVERLGHAQDDLIIVNYANADMVGHTGDFAATVTACEVIDSCIGRLVAATEAAGGGVLITADHGNAEHKVDPRNHAPLTAHTTSPVPVILCGTEARGLRPGGGLADIAPTVLAALAISIPPEMTGRSLVDAGNPASPGSA